MSNLNSLLPCAPSDIAALLTILFIAIDYPQVRRLPAEARIDARSRQPAALLVTRRSELYPDRG